MVMTAVGMAEIAVIRCHQEEAPSGTHPVGSAVLDSSMLRILGAAVHHLVEPLRDARVVAGFTASPRRRPAGGARR